jgi:hypothetical protein
LRDTHNVGTGGTGVEIKLGGGKVLCGSQTVYAEKPEFVYARPNMGADKPARDHISSMTPCLKDLKTQDLNLRKSQSVELIGKYDYEKHAGNVEDGKQGEVSLG